MQAFAMAVLAVLVALLVWGIVKGFLPASVTS